MHSLAPVTTAVLVAAAVVLFVPHQQARIAGSFSLKKGAAAADALETAAAEFDSPAPAVAAGDAASWGLATSPPSYLHHPLAARDGCLHPAAELLQIPQHQLTQTG
eukprot:GHRR01019704.1.p4 GENE.GHRR01019704.1~~GHRR01019704.1.p4  ORF type:complete len:106 (-),score=53.92 GHRR01019704.1:1951-2268(-)